MVKTKAESAEIAAFFEQWAIYEKVVSLGYMAHEEVFQALLDAVKDRPAGGRFLELGCGDAGMAAQLLKHCPHDVYHGADITGPVLGIAEKNLENCGAEVTLHHEHLLDFVRNADHSYEVIYAGYAVHHLSHEEKRDFFQHARKRLADGGCLLMTDVVLRPGKQREESIALYLDWIHRNWTEMTEREMALIDTHISECDYPEEIATLLSMAADAGFQAGETRWSDASGFHHLISFQR